MAASQSLTEGLPPAKPSFAEMIRGSQVQPKQIIKEACVHKGEPALNFTVSEIEELSASLRFVLIGKFQSDHPSMEFLRRGFTTIGFKGQFRLGLIDSKHILIRFDQEEDYQRCWLHSSWKFKHHVMKVLKWTPEFSVKEESPVVPVWVSLEQLPLYLFSKHPLFSIGKILGNPLKMDAATISLSRPSVARICIEIDLRNPLPSRIWIGVPNGGFWQPIKYDHLPDYCFDCFSLGHTQSACGKQIDAAKAKKVWSVKNDTQNLDSQAAKAPVVVGTKEVISGISSQPDVVPQVDLITTVTGQAVTGFIPSPTIPTSAQQQLTLENLDAGVADHQHTSGLSTTGKAALVLDQNVPSISASSNGTGGTKGVCENAKVANPPEVEPPLLMASTSDGEGQAVEPTFLVQTLNPNAAEFAMAIKTIPASSIPSEISVADEADVAPQDDFPSPDSPAQQPVFVGTEDYSNHNPQIDAIENPQPACLKAPIDSPTLIISAPQNDFSSAQEGHREAVCSTLIDTSSTQEQIAIKENSLIDIHVQEEDIEEEFIKVKPKNQGRGRGRGRGRNRGGRGWTIPPKIEIDPSLYF